MLYLSFKADAKAHIRKSSQSSIFSSSVAHYLDVYDRPLDFIRDVGFPTQVPAYYSSYRCTDFSSTHQ